MIRQIFWNIWWFFWPPTSFMSIFFTFLAYLVLVLCDLHHKRSKFDSWYLIKYCTQISYWEMADIGNFYWFKKLKSIFEIANDVGETENTIFNIPFLLDIFKKDAYIFPNYSFCYLSQEEISCSTNFFADHINFLNCSAPTKYLYSR